MKVFYLTYDPDCKRLKMGGYCRLGGMLLKFNNKEIQRILRFTPSIDTGKIVIKNEETNKIHIKYVMDGELMSASDFKRHNLILGLAGVKDK